MKSSLTSDMSFPVIRSATFVMVLCVSRRERRPKDDPALSVVETVLTNCSFRRDK